MVDVLQTISVTCDLVRILTNAHHELFGSLFVLVNAHHIGCNGFRVLKDVLEILPTCV